MTSLFCRVNSSDRAIVKVPTKDGLQFLCKNPELNLLKKM